MTRDEVIAVVHQRQAALTARNMDGLGVLYADGAEIRSPLAGSSRGRDAVLKSFRVFLNAFPDVIFNAEEPIVDGDRVAVPTEISGTDTNGILGNPASGRPFRFLAVLVLTIQNHQIVREERVYDFTGLLIQIGVLKAKPA